MFIKGRKIPNLVILTNIYIAFECLNITIIKNVVSDYEQGLSLVKKFIN